MPTLANDINGGGVPIALAGRSGSITGTTVGAIQQIQAFSIKDGYGKNWFMGPGVAFLWKPPFDYSAVANYSGPPVTPPILGAMLEAFTLETDFGPAAMMIDSQSLHFPTPGIGSAVGQGQRTEFVGKLNTPPDWHNASWPYGGKAHLIWVGSLVRQKDSNPNLPDLPGATGTFKLSWDYSNIPTIGSENEAAAFFDPILPIPRSVTYIDRAVVPPIDSNFSNPRQFFFKAKFVNGAWTGDPIPAGKYWVVFAGGAYSLNQNGFADPTPETVFVASAEDAIVGFFQGGLHYSASNLYYSDGLDFETLPFGAFTAFPPDLPNRAYFTRWSLRWYRPGVGREITHRGGKIWIDATGCVGFSDPAGALLPPKSNLTIRANDPKWFLYQVVP
jgi:hypothetical protein